ncbi:hypothetical protein [Brevibacterium album]|uniref:hypothetical protein n=1 Tax=Brevibacterium album TaxID=417948 RepID=UPI00041B4A8C|nr:hypothetical protein [Brevibacterium album]
MKALFGILNLVAHLAGCAAFVLAVFGITGTAILIGGLSLAWFLTAIAFGAAYNIGRSSGLKNRRE